MGTKLKVQRSKLKKSSRHQAPIIDGRLAGRRGLGAPEAVPLLDGKTFKGWDGDDGDKAQSSKFKAQEKLQAPSSNNRRPAAWPPRTGRAGSRSSPGRQDVQRLGRGRWGQSSKFKVQSSRKAPGTKLQ